MAASNIVWPPFAHPTQTASATVIAIYKGNVYNEVNLDNDLKSDYSHFFD